MSTPSGLVFSLIPTIIHRCSSSSPLFSHLYHSSPTCTHINLFFSFSFCLTHTCISFKQTITLSAQTSFRTSMFKGILSLWGGFDIKTPKQELSFMTLHSSFYAFSAYSFKKKRFMNVLCCIVINYPTHWYKTGWGSTVKLYYD